jgi:hypothetical protein
MTLPGVGPLPADPEQALAMLAEHHPEAVRLGCGYTPRVPATDWKRVAPFVALGLAALAAAGAPARAQQGWLLRKHVSAALARGAHRSVTGIYSFAEVEKTLNTKASKHTGAAQATTLRRASQLLAPAGQPPKQVQVGRRDGLAPYDEAELGALLDAATTLPTPMWRARASLALALTAGAGLTSADCHALRTDSLTASSDGVLVHVPGPRARTVALWHELDQLAVAAWDSVLVHDHAGTEVRKMWPTRAALGTWFDETDWLQVAKPNAYRLRATWTALVLGSGCPVADYITAAHVTGIDSWLAPVRWLPPAPAEEQQANVRGSRQPYTPSGRELDGRPWPTPTLQLRAVGA